MKRRISFLVVAFLGVALTAGAAEAKPEIAVLGIEVGGSGHKLQERTTRLAKWLTAGLRRNASLGRPYELAPNSNKDLLEMKLLSDCADEKPSCMASIGKGLGADHLLYGRIEKHNHGYEVSLKLLDVHSHAMERTTTDLIPDRDATRSGMREWADRLYDRLTGTSSAMPLVIHTNADTGTVSVDGRIAASLSGGSAKVTGLSPGKHKVSVDADGYASYAETVTIASGHPTRISAVLTKTGAGATPVRPGHGYRVAFWSTLAASSVAGAAWTITGLQVRYSIKDDQLNAIRQLQKNDKTRDYSGPDACAVAAKAAAAGVTGAQAAVNICNEGKSRAVMANIFMAATIVGVLASSYFYYKGYKDSGAENEHRGDGGGPTVQVTPALGPNLIGAGVAIEF